MQPPSTIIPLLFFIVIYCSSLLPTYAVCVEDLEAALPDIYNDYCVPNDLILWKEGIEDGISTSSDPLIDYNFIICQESFSVCGYVSSCDEVEDETVGITIGAGVDLAQQTSASLMTLGGLVLDDYVGLTGSAAVAAICYEPFNITQTEAYDLSINVMNEYVNELQTWYDNQRDDTITVAFTELQLGIRTVLTSIRFEWGNYSNYATFWDYIVSNDFENAANELRSWYDNCATDIRLMKEANVIDASLGCSSSSGIDCVFLIDESGSVGSDNFELSKDWMVDFVESFESSISDDVNSGSRFGAMSFDSSHLNQWNLNTYSTIDDYRTAIEAIPYNGGGTALGNALEQTATLQFTEAYGMRASSRGISRVLIVMTDGISYDDVEVGVATLSDLNLNIIVIGISNYNLEQLQYVTTDEFIYTLDTFTALDEILAGITMQTCYAPTQLDIISANTVTNITVNDGETQYFEFSTSSLNSDEKMILNINQNSGCVYAYVSYCVQYPSYFVNVVEFASCTQPIKQIILNPTSSECSDSSTIYLAIEGRSTECDKDDTGESSYNLDIETCDETQVECVNGTNYDADLDTDDPYSIDDATKSPTIYPTTEPTVVPTTNPSETPTEDPTPAPTSVECVKGVNYEIDGNPCVAWGDPHFTTFHGTEHDYQGEPGGLYYYVRPCPVDSTYDDMPFSIVGKHYIYNATTTGLEYLSMELYDDNGDKYILFVSASFIAYMSSDIDDSTELLYHLYMDSVTSLSDFEDENAAIGNRFQVYHTKPNGNRTDVILTIDNECEVKLIMEGQYNYKADENDMWPRWRMHKFVLEPPECYKCFICGLCAGFKTAYIEDSTWQQLESCTGDVVEYRNGLVAEAYDINGLSFEYTYCTNAANEMQTSETRRRLSTDVYEIDVGTDFELTDVCDDSVEDDVIVACQKGRDDQVACCDTIGGGFCDKVQAGCEVDICASVGSNSAVIDEFVDTFFTGVISLVCDIPNIGEMFVEANVGIVGSTDTETSVSASTGWNGWPLVIGISLGILALVIGVYLCCKKFGPFARNRADHQYSAVNVVDTTTENDESDVLDSEAPMIAN